MKFGLEFGRVECGEEMKGDEGVEGGRRRWSVVSKWRGWWEWSVVSGGGRKEWSLAREWRGSRGMKCGERVVWRRD